jgi:NAD(P)-dependent dehydrogenase (short-subunit alcohol dehydrogenase family)
MTCNSAPMLLVNTITSHFQTRGIDISDLSGHFYFAKLLIPMLKEGAKSSPDGKARIVTTSSPMHMLVNDLDFATFKDGLARKRKSKDTLYSQSKYVCIYLRSILGFLIFTGILIRLHL